MRLLPRRQSQLERGANDPVLSLDGYMEAVQSFIYNGTGYGFLGGTGQYTSPGQRQETIGNSYSSLSEMAMKTNSVVFACMATRAMHFSEARFQFQELNKGRPGKLFGDQSLGLLEEPWPGATTGDLLTRMLTHVDLAGNAFVTEVVPGRVECLRPDWVTIVIGNRDDPDADAWSVTSEVLGYVYQEGGPGSGRNPVSFLADEVAHFIDMPDPHARFRGMSWLTPLVRDVMGDKAMTQHKLSFFEKGATPNLLVKLDVPDLKSFREWIAEFKDQHEGPQNAYRAMFLAAGADATVIGTNLNDLDYKVVQSAGETRIAAAARTPPVMVGLSEGLQGSALNSGNYQAARRMFADGTMRPLWRKAAGSLERLVAPPRSASRLWYDDRDIAFLKEDLKERADVFFVHSQSARQLIDAGFMPESVVLAIEAEDFSLLKHSGRFSVQLQPAGAPKQGLFTGTPEPVNGAINGSVQKQLPAAA